MPILTLELPWKSQTQTTRWVIGPQISRIAIWDYQWQGLNDLKYDLANLMPVYAYLLRSDYSDYPSDTDTVEPKVEYHGAGRRPNDSQSLPVNPGHVIIRNQTVTNIEIASRQDTLYPRRASSYTPGQLMWFKANLYPHLIHWRDSHQTLLKKMALENASMRLERIVAMLLTSGERLKEQIPEICIALADAAAQKFKP